MEVLRKGFLEVQKHPSDHSVTDFMMSVVAWYAAQSYECQNVGSMGQAKAHPMPTPYEA